MVGQLDDLDEPALLERAGDDEARLDELRAEVVVHLVAVAVALVDDRLAVGLARARPVGELDRLGAEAHRAAEVLDLLLLGQQVDHRDTASRDPSRSSWRRRARRRGARTRRPRRACRGRCRGTGSPRSRATRQARILPSQPREPKPPGTSTPSTCSSSRSRLLERHALGVDPAHAHVAAVVDARVLERLVHREVGVVELHVLADERDLDRRRRARRSARSARPTRRGRPAAAARPSFSQTSSSRPSRLQRLRDEVDVAARRAFDDRPPRGSTSAKSAILSRMSRDSSLVRAADDDVRVDTDAAQLVDRVLRRLRLQLAGRVDERHERDVEVEDVLGPDLAAELADRLEERQRLDVADGAADLAR